MHDRNGNGFMASNAWPAAALLIADCDASFALRRAHSIPCIAVVIGDAVPHGPAALSSAQASSGQLGRVLHSPHVTTIMLVT
jgi:hypothetical protein